MENEFKLTVVHFVRPNPPKRKLRTGPTGLRAVGRLRDVGRGPLGLHVAGPPRAAVGLLLAKPDSVERDSKLGVRVTNFFSRFSFASRTTDNRH